MKQLELTSQVSDLWSHLDQMRSQRASNHPLESVIAPFTASLLLIRWADHMDTEQEVVEVSDDHDSLPVLPRDRHWSSWFDLRGERLVAVLRGEILPALRNAPNSSLGYSLQRLVPVFEELAGEPPELIAKSNGRSLMSRKRLPETSVSNSSESESLSAAASTNSRNAK